MINSVFKLIREVLLVTQLLKVAVYYRQSTEAQIGNVSTTMQTVDMVNGLLAAGFQMEDIILIDQDAGVSGTTGIDDRVGLAYLVHELIEKDVIGAVIAQDVDRFFRDRDQIDTNRFVKACRDHQVKVVTPTTLYDFNDSYYGDLFVHRFREETERGADYIRHHIKGRLHPAREKLIREGKWAGQGIPTGYMVDEREKLPDGSPNPDDRQLSIFKPYAVVIVAIFDLFEEMDGNLLQTWKAMEGGRLCFPEWDAKLVEPGFRVVDQLKRRSKVTGQRVPAYNALGGILTNPAYLGHFAHKGEILYFDHHPAIVPEDTFFFAFNRLSKTTLTGEPNPNYIPQRPMSRQKPKKRRYARPICAGMIYSDDFVDMPNRRVIIQWNQRPEYYIYRLAKPDEGKSRWAVNANNVDAVILDMLKTALAELQVDPAAWQAAVASLQSGASQHRQRLEQTLKDERAAKETLLAGIRAYTNEELRAEAEKQFNRTGQRIQLLERELAELEAQQVDESLLKDAQAILREVLDNWEACSDPHKRKLLELLTRRITMSGLEDRKKHITITWRMGATTSQVLSHVKGRGQPWSQLQLDNLKYLFEHQVDQVEILKQFPGRTWRNLKDLYAYHFNNNSRDGVYPGAQPYTQDTRWEDTREYRESQAAEDPTSSNPSMTAGTGGGLRPLGWFEVVAALRTVGLLAR